MIQAFVGLRLLGHCRTYSITVMLIKLRKECGVVIVSHIRVRNQCRIQGRVAPIYAPHEGRVLIHALLISVLLYEAVYAGIPNGSYKELTSSPSFRR